MPENNNDYHLENSTTNMSLEAEKEEIEEQYRILKEEEEKEARRKSLVLIVLFLFVFTILFTGAGFSYMTYKKALDNQANNVVEKQNDKKDEETDGVKELVIMFDAGTEYIAEDIIPGWESEGSKDFSVTNNGSLSADYNVVFTNIENTFTNLEDLHYTIKCNEVVLLEDLPVPASEQIVLNKQTVAPGTINHYEIFFKYVDTGVNQNIDVAKNYKLSVLVTASEEK